MRRIFPKGRPALPTVQPEAPKEPEAPPAPAEPVTPAAASAGRSPGSEAIERAVSYLAGLDRDTTAMSHFIRRPQSERYNSATLASVSLTVTETQVEYDVREMAYVISGYGRAGSESFGFNLHVPINRIEMVTNDVCRDVAELVSEELMAVVRSQVTAISNSIAVSVLSSMHRRGYR